MISYKAGQKPKTTPKNYICIYKNFKNIALTSEKHIKY